MNTQIPIQLILVILTLTLFPHSANAQSRQDKLSELYSHQILQALDSDNNQILSAREIADALNKLTTPPNQSGQQDQSLPHQQSSPGTSKRSQLRNNTQLELPTADHFLNRLLIRLIQSHGVRELTQNELHQQIQATLLQADANGDGRLMQSELSTFFDQVNDLSLIPPNRINSDGDFANRPTQPKAASGKITIDDVEFRGAPIKIRVFKELGLLVMTGHEQDIEAMKILFADYIHQSEKPTESSK